MVDDPDEPPAPRKSTHSTVTFSQGARTGRPDTEAFERKLRELDGEIFVVKGALSRIKLDAHPDAIRQSANARIKQLTLDKSHLHEERAKLRSESLSLDVEFQQLTEDMRSMRPKLRFTSEEELKQALDALEQRQEHSSSMTLREEKKILAEIRDLELSRPLLFVYIAKGQRMGRIRVEQETLEGRSRAIWARINSMSEEISMEEARKRNVSDRDCGEGAQLKARLETLETARAAVVSGFEEERKSYQDRQRLVKLAEIIKKRLPSNSDRRRSGEEGKRDPLYDQILKCDFTIGLLKRYLPTPQTTISSPPSANLVFAEGEELLLDKRMRAAQDRQNFYKGGPKKKQRNKRNSSDFAIPLSLEMVAFLSGLRIRVPGTVSEIPATLEALRRRKEQVETSRYSEEKEEEDGKEDSGSDSTASPSTGAV